MNNALHQFSLKSNSISLIKKASPKHHALGWPLNLS